jgi:RNA polymerase sigma factor (sigma-70 family)
MSGTQSSQSLLAEYAKNGSEHAFRELVTAYIDFVFGTALRVVGGDRALAEDVSQTVFTDLARKAITLPREVKLGGWLHRHTCFVGRKALRRERRRIARERQAMQLTTIEDYTEENLGQLSTLLDETINGLGKEDRNAIILRFFEQLDYRALGTALGSSEDAGAHARLARARKNGIYPATPGRGDVAFGPELCSFNQNSRRGAGWAGDENISDCPGTIAQGMGDSWLFEGRVLHATESGHW